MPTTLPEPSNAAIALAFALMREFPGITHGISIPEEVHERNEREFQAKHIARFAQVVMAVQAIEQTQKEHRRLAAHRFPDSPR